MYPHLPLPVDLVTAVAVLVELERELNPDVEPDELTGAITTLIFWIARATATDFDVLLDMIDGEIENRAKVITVAACDYHIQPEKAQ